MPANQPPFVGMCQPSDQIIHVLVRPHSVCHRIRSNARRSFVSCSSDRPGPGEPILGVTTGHLTSSVRTRKLLDSVAIVKP